MASFVNGQHHETRQWQQEQFAPGAPSGISLTERQLWHINKDDHAWRAEYLAEMPNFLARYFGDRYSKLMEAGQNGRRRANTFLRTTLGKNVLPRLREVRKQYATDCVPPCWPPVLPPAWVQRPFCS